MAGNSTIVWTYHTVPVQAIYIFFVALTVICLLIAYRVRLVKTGGKWTVEYDEE